MPPTQSASRWTYIVYLFVYDDSLHDQGLLIDLRTLSSFYFTIVHPHVFSAFALFHISFNTNRILFQCEALDPLPAINPYRTHLLLDTLSAIITPIIWSLIVPVFFLTVSKVKSHNLFKSCWIFRRICSERTISTLNRRLKLPSILLVNSNLLFRICTFVKICLYSLS